MTVSGQQFTSREKNFEVQFCPVVRNTVSVSKNLPYKWDDLKSDQISCWIAHSVTLSKGRMSGKKWRDTKQQPSRAKSSQ